VVKKRRGTKQRWTSAAARRVVALAGESVDVEEAIRILVEQMLWADYEIPIDLERFAQRLNVKEMYSDDLPFSGELRRNGEGYDIVYSSHLSTERKRFTIAHELGHALLETSGKGAPKHGVELERICDKFAAEILMPTQHFRASCGKIPSVEKVVHLANLYQTSLSATAIRCAELFKATVFEVNGDFVTWGFGIVQKGPLARKDPSLRMNVTRILETKNNSEIFSYSTREWGGRWILEGQKLGQNRTLFLFRPHYGDIRLPTAA